MRFGGYISFLGLAVSRPQVRGPALFSAKIPLTPGPLVVVIKPAQAQAFNASGPQPYWPPRDPDQVAQIAMGESVVLRLPTSIGTRSDISHHTVIAVLEHHPADGS